MPDAADASTDGDAKPVGDAPREQGDTASPEPDGGKPEVGADAAKDIAADTVASDAADALADASEVSSRRAYRAIAVTLGRYHACALLDDHQVKCWGENAYGQLGLGDHKFRGLDLAEMGDALPAVDLGTGRTAKAVAAGRYATCAILDTDELKCWGMGDMAAFPGGKEDRGDAPGEMGDALPTIDLGPGRKARRVAISYSDTCVERDDGKLRCWGLNGGPIDRDVGKITFLAGASTYVIALLDDGTLVNVTASATPVERPPLPRPAVSVGGALSTWCALLDDGKPWCSYPLEDPPPAGVKVKQFALSERRGFTALLADGTVRSWSPFSTAFPWTKAPAGDPLGGATLALGQPVQALAGGGFDHTCALLADGGVKCWSKLGGTKESAIGLGPNEGISGTTWRSVDLGTRPE